jgi:hypothetical protein
VFAAPPARWIPTVSAWWASGESAPTDIAETTKRRAIERAGSTAASGIGAAPRGRRTRRRSRTTVGRGRSIGDGVAGAGSANPEAAWTSATTTGA